MRLAVLGSTGMSVQLSGAWLLPPVVSKYYIYLIRSAASNARAFSIFPFLEAKRATLVAGEGKQWQLECAS